MQLALIPLAALVGFDAYATVADDHPRALALRVLLSLPLGLEALILLAGYAAYVYLERSRGREALYRTRPGLANEDAFGLVLFLVVLGPWSLFAIYTPAIWASQHHPLWIRVAGQALLALLPLTVYSIIYVLVRLGGWEWGDEGGGGGGPDEPPDPDGPDPSWWADFERQFRSYSGSPRGSAPREPAGVA